MQGISISRRKFCIGFMAGGLLLIAGKGSAMGLFGKSGKKGGAFPYILSEEEWRAKLSPEAYHVLRERGTERAFTSKLNDEKRRGLFHCAGCNSALFDRDHKFESGTGWPSFWQPVTPQAVGISTDYAIGVGRTEVHCANCGGHLGHVFEDGPKPTGLRYCTNGVALTFMPA